MSKTQAPEGAPGDMVLVPRELIKDASESVDDYRCSLEFGAHDRKLLGRLKAALAAPAPQAPAWQPIETAPRDTYVLCWWNKDKIEGAAWDWDEYKPGQRHWHYMQDGDSPTQPPSHWMPLPTAPQTKEPTNDR